MCDDAHSCMWLFSFVLQCRYFYVCDVTHSRHTYYQTQGVRIGWRRCLGCLKLHVSFRKRPTNQRALLRKMTCKDKTSYASSPPCITWLIYLCDGTHSLVWCNLFMCVTPLLHILISLFIRVQRDSFIIHLLPRARCVWCDSFIHVPWLIHLCDTTPS